MAVLYLTLNDKQEMVPTIESLRSLHEKASKVNTLLADKGYFSESNVKDCIKAEIKPFIATGQQGYNQPLRERFSQPEVLPENAGPVDKMTHHLKTTADRQLYAKRKSTVEPVFGIIKQFMGFRQFFLRGYEAVTGEWALVSIAWNLKRMFVLNG